jgi:phosphatidylserine decarboxylase
MRTGAWPSMQQALPQRLLGRIVYRISRSRLAWLKAPLIAWFARHYRVDLAEAESADLSAYPTFNAFFTRALHEDARPIDSDPEAVVSPADGRLTEFGAIESGQLIQAKGLHYAVDELLGEQANASADFERSAFLANGRFATIYLAPRDYHRVHMPIGARLLGARYVPGSRFTVNDAAASRIERLFCRNERLVAWFDAEGRTAVLVLVGALNVASIGTVSYGEIPSGKGRQWREHAPVPFAKGAEFGRFNLGSTVILLFEAGAMRFDSALYSGMRLAMGQRIGRLASRRAERAVS